MTCFIFIIPGILDLKGYLKLIEMADFQQSNIIMSPKLSDSILNGHPGI